MVQPITGQRDPAAKSRPKPVDSPPRVGEAFPTSDGVSTDTGRIAGGRPDSDFPDATEEERAVKPQTIGGQTAEPAVSASGKMGDPNKPAVGAQTPARSPNVPMPMNRPATPTQPAPKATTPAAGADVARKPVRPM